MSDKLVKTSLDVEVSGSLAKKVEEALGSDSKLAVLINEERATACRRCGHGIVNHRVELELRPVRAECMITSGGVSCSCKKYVPPIALANLSPVPADGRWPFPPGKYAGTLKSVSFERALTGKRMLVFQLQFAASGGTYEHRMGLEGRAQMSMASSQLDRLGIDPEAINGMLNNLNMDVVVVIVEKLTRTGRKFTSVWLRKPDDTDEGEM